jgi:hypothetical protein
VFYRPHNIFKIGIIMSSREWILCSIKCQNMRLNMQSNPLKYPLESLKYAAIRTINPKYASISNELKLGF